MFTENVVGSEKESSEQVVLLWKWLLSVVVVLNRTIYMTFQELPMFRDKRDGGWGRRGAGGGGGSAQS